MYEQSSQKVLNYFIETGRLVTVDVTCGVAELIWHQVHHVFCELDFRPQRTVNTILLFVFGTILYDNSTHLSSSLFLKTG